MGEIYFYGSSSTRLSPKGQVALPKRFRDIIPESEREAGFVLIPGQGDCLYLYTHQQFGKIRESARAIALRDNDPEFFRTFMEEASPVDLDTQGRFVLPQSLRELAGLEEALFIGMDDRIEIWSPSRRAAARVAPEAYRSKREAGARDIFGI